MEWKTMFECSWPNSESDSYCELIENSCETVTDPIHMELVFQHDF